MYISDSKLNSARQLCGLMEHPVLRFPRCSLLLTKDILKAQNLMALHFCLVKNNHVGIITLYGFLFLGLLLEIGLVDSFFFFSALQTLRAVVFKTFFLL